MLALLQNAATAVADFTMAVIPRPVPGLEALRDCRIISHRGEFDNSAVMENTLEAFHIARHHNVWGIECDIRWTADLVPVICHDSDGRRVFGEPVVIADVTFSELRKRLPLIPSLTELVAEFGGTTHLMLEIKAVPDSQPEQQGKLLTGALAGLQPGADYHFLALDPDLFEQATFIPAEYCLPVAETNVDGPGITLRRRRAQQDKPDQPSRLYRLVNRVLAGDADGGYQVEFKTISHPLSYLPARCW